MARPCVIREADEMQQQEEPCATASPCEEVLQALWDCNEQCLRLLAKEAGESRVGAPPLLRDLAGLWLRLDAGACRRAAQCPYLLIDAGFADPQRWRWHCAAHVSDTEPAVAQVFFTSMRPASLAHQILSVAWYVARTQPLGAPLFLGMPAACVAWWRACSPCQVAELAEQHPLWLRPRWPARTSLWRDLLAAAVSHDGLALELARLHGVQLLASELRASAARTGR
jgi:hypothetical protein